MGSIQVINADNSNISSGILGTVATTSLLSHLKNKFNNNYNSINDIFQKEKQFFVNKFVNPIRKTITTIKNITRDYKYNNTFRSITKEEDLKYIPPSMYEPILCYRPIYELLKEERIFGFGINIKDIRTDDPYERMINNGLCENVDELLKQNKKIECVNIWKDDDPDISYEQIDYIEDTRKFIDEILNNSKYDPTDYPNNRG